MKHDRKIVDEMRTQAQKDMLTPDIHIVGLVKTSVGRYAVVTGTVASPIVDTVSQPLEYAAETLKVAAMRLLMVVP